MKGRTNAGGGAGKSEGQYVWKKYIFNEGTITITQTTSANAKPATMKLASNTIDLSKVKLEQLAGLTTRYGPANNPTQWVLEFKSSTQIILDKNPYPITWNPETAEITLYETFAASVVFTPFEALVKWYDSYIVSDDPGTYPSEGKQGGYWYELYALPEGLSTYALDEAAATIANEVAG